MKNKIIAFSGSSFSGKTTAINKLKNFYGAKSVSLNEIIRKKITNIDEARKNPYDYLLLQEEIISQKFEQEKNCFEQSDKGLIYLVDRSLSDSFFYFLFYVKKEEFSDVQFDKYMEVFSKVRAYYNYSHKFLYDGVVCFSPLFLEKDVKDPLRPSKIDYLKEIEYFIIDSFNKTGGCKNIIDFNPNTEKTEKLIQFINSI